ncbi:MAG: universal stress protein [Anaerolineae bacterium]|nr:universal stress protein [Anaerolineae bacterium]
MAAQVLPHVRALATLFRARVTFMQATADEASNVDVGPGPDFLAFAAADLASTGIATDTLVAQGPPADAILDTAEQHSVDLIALCTHGRGGIPRFLLGSVAANLIGNTTMPLLIVRAKQASVDGVPTQTIDFRKILVPLDGSPLGGQRAADRGRDRGQGRSNRRAVAGDARAERRGRNQQQHPNAALDHRGEDRRRRRRNG